MTTVYQELKKQYDSDGFAVVRNFLANAELETLQHELDQYIQHVAPGLPPTAAFYDDAADPETLQQLQHMQFHSEFFTSYMSNPLWLGLATALNGERSHCQGPEWFNKPPNAQHPTPAHQDNYYFCLEPCNVVTLWLALDQADKKNGCLRYYCGSHLNSILPHDSTSVLGFSQGITTIPDQYLDQQTVVNVQPGDLIAHHGAVIHRADANLTENRQRRAFAMVYRGESCQVNQDQQQQYQAALQTQHAALNARP